MLGGIKLGCMAHQIQKYFLGNVLRVLRIFYQTEGGPEHGIAKLLHRRFRGEGRHLGRFHGAGPPFSYRIQHNWPYYCTDILDCKGKWAKSAPDPSCPAGFCPQRDAPGAPFVLFPLPRLAIGGRPAQRRGAPKAANRRGKHR